uniref:Ovule protein n=1 Tax=Caenorhabditis tropicalis TaxID=1561998 RepID=A0A1I7TYC4_9PELO
MAFTTCMSAYKCKSQKKEMEKRPIKNGCCLSTKTFWWDREKRKNRIDYSHPNGEAGSQNLSSLLNNKSLPFS